AGADEFRGFFSGLCFDEVAEVGIFTVSRGRLERDGLLRHLHHRANAFNGICISSAISSGVASRPKSCTSCFCTRISLLIVSIMCTGMRMVRAWSAMERVMAWRIHQVA